MFNNSVKSRQMAELFTMAYCLNYGMVTVEVVYRNSSGMQINCADCIHVLFPAIRFIRFICFTASFFISDLISSSPSSPLGHQGSQGIVYIPASQCMQLVYQNMAILSVFRFRICGTTALCRNCIRSGAVSFMVHTVKAFESS